MFQKRQQQVMILLLMAHAFEKPAAVPPSLPPAATGQLSSSSIHGEEACVKQ
jgi:hypothetical protein